MPRLIVQTQVSLDGYMGAPDGDLEWLLWHWQEDWPWDPALRDYHQHLHTSCRVALLSGRMMAGPGFLDHWAEVATRDGDPQQTFARAIMDADKIGFSRGTTHDEVTWPNTRYATRPLREEVTALKREAPTHIVAWGGSGFVQSLLREDLVDDLHLLVNPTALGDGLPVFPTGAPRNYKLLDATPHACGVVLQRYSRIGA